MTNEIAILDANVVPAVLFGGKKEDGSEPLLDLIVKFEEHARSLDLDVTTKKGRKEIASFAHQIARTKTTLDAMGKELTEEKRKTIAAVNEDRNFAKERMQALQDEIRKPLTDWENKEKNRVASHEAALNNIRTLLVLRKNHENDFKYYLQDLEARLKELGKYRAVSWEEFEAKAFQVIDEGRAKIEEEIKLIKKAAAEALELETLRKEKEARETKEREDKIASDAAAAAKKKAEDEAEETRKAAELKATEERKAEEKKRREAEDAAEAKRKKERDDAEQEKKAAEDRAAAAELKTKQLEEQAEKDKADAKEREEAAKQRERDKIAAEKKAGDEATAARAADKENRTLINNTALNALVKAGLSELDGKKAIAAIAKNEIPGIRIFY